MTPDIQHPALCPQCGQEPVSEAVWPEPPVDVGLVIREAAYLCQYGHSWTSKWLEGATA